MIAFELTLLHLSDPDLPELRAVEAPAADAETATAVLHLLKLGDERDDRYEVLFDLDLATDEEGMARARVGRKVPTFVGWGLELSPLDGDAGTELRLTLDLPLDPRDARPVHLDWSGPVGPGRTVLRPTDDLLLVVDALPVEAVDQAAAVLAERREAVLARLAPYDLGRARERRRAVEDLLAR